jgi:hypothetical protein
VPARAKAIPPGLTEGEWSEYLGAARSIDKDDEQADYVGCYLNPTHTFPPLYGRKGEVYHYHSGYYHGGKLLQKGTHCTIQQRCAQCGTIRVSIRLQDTFEQVSPYTYLKPNGYPTVHSLGIGDRWAFRDAVGVETLRKLRRLEREGAFKDHDVAATVTQIRTSAGGAA